MVRAKNYETMSTFVKVMQKKTLASFFPDTVYIISCQLLYLLHLFLPLFCFGECCHCAPAQLPGIIRPINYYATVVNCPPV